MADEKKQNFAVRALSGISRSIKSYNQQVAHEKTFAGEVKQNNPDRYAKDWHIWGIEAPPTKVKTIESIAALVLGYVGLRSTYYGLSAATDTVAEKGQPAGILRQISGAIRSVFGIATLGIATMFAAHAWRINIPDLGTSDTSTPGRT